MNRKNITAILLAGLIWTVTSCKKTFDINQDPNNPSLEVGTPKLVFPIGAMSVAGVTGGDMALLGGILSEQFTQAAASNQYKYIDQYDIRSTAIIHSMYTTMYIDGLKNLQYVIDKAKQTEDWNFFLMGTVMKTYAAALMVDLYDEIPYSEAFQGVANLQPRFDDGYSVYTLLLAEIEGALNKDFNASTVIDLTATNEGNIDIVFNGDMNKWKQFANTLELKLYLRMINAKPAEAEAGIKALYDRNASFLRDDARITGFTDAASKSNPLYEQNVRQLNTPDNLRASATLSKFLQANADPRVQIYYTGTTYLDQGDYNNSSPGALTASRLRQSATDPVVFLSAAESYFLQAEARERYYGGTGAKAAYDNGVLKAFSVVGLNGAAFVAAAGAYEYPAAGTLQEKIEAIITQKWASLPYGLHFIEGWFDRNRTGYPRTSPVYSSDPAYVPGEFVIAKNTVLQPGQFPKRLVFPDRERSTNPNTPAEVPIFAHVWWGL